MIVDQYLICFCHRPHPVQYDMIGQEYPLGDMQPYEYDDAVIVQQKLRDIGVPSILAEQ